MNPVGDVVDGDILYLEAGPQASPHLAGNHAVFLRHSVMVLGDPEGKSGHVKAGSRLAGVVPETEKRCLVDTKLLAIFGEIPAHKIKGENIVPGWDRGMSGKNGGSFCLVHGSLETHAGCHPLPDPFQSAQTRDALH